MKRETNIFRSELFFLAVSQFPSVRLGDRSHLSTAVSKTGSAENGCRPNQSYCRLAWSTSFFFLIYMVMAHWSTGSVDNKDRENDSTWVVCLVWQVCWNMLEKSLSVCITPDVLFISTKNRCFLSHKHMLWVLIRSASALLMSTHNICFREEMIPRLYLELWNTVTAY